MKSTHHLNVSQRVGVVEQAVNVTSTEELIKQTAKRSVGAEVSASSPRGFHAQCFGPEAGLRAPSC